MTIRHRGRQHSASDTVRYVKQHYVPPPVGSPDRHSVTARTEFVYKSKLSEGTSRPSRYSRHIENKNRGHFSNPLRPYQTLGEVSLDANALFCNVLGVEPRPDHSNYYHHDHDHHVTLVDLDHRHGHGYAYRDRSPKERLLTPINKDGPTGESSSGSAVPFSRDHAGLTAIRGQLKEKRLQKMALQAGQDYRQYLKQCAVKALALEEFKNPSGEMRIQPITSDHYNLGPNRKYTLAYDPETMTMLVKSKADDQPNARVPQKNQDFLQHLDAINIILTSILNLKSRHLRTRNPLGHDVVYSLRKASDPHAIGLKSNTLERSSGTNQKLASTAQYSMISFDQDISGKSLYTMHTHTPNMQSSTLKPNDPHSMRYSRRLNPHGKHSSLKKDESPHRMDTWEDIITDGKSKGRHKRPWNISLDQQRASFVLIRLHPIDREKVQSTVMTMVRDQKEDMENLKQSFAKQTQDKINKHLRDRSMVHERKLEGLRDLHPLWEEKRRQMTKMSTHQMQQSQQEQGAIPKQEAEWFENLRAQATELNLANVESFLKLDKLARFATEDFPFLTNAKEKLCLLTVSLPIDEICTPAFKKAVQFILGDIFGLSRDLLRQWLAYRHIHEP